MNVGVDEFKDCSELSRRLYRLKRIRHAQLLLIEREKETTDKSHHLPIIHPLITTLSNINLVINEETTDNPEAIT